MGKKIFRSLDEQIEILKSKGLVIDNEDNAKNILFRENYFFLNGYRHVFMKEDNKKQFIDNTSFEELYSLFWFDRQFRNIIFKNLLIVENNYKSIASYTLSKKFGYMEKDYLKTSNFVSSKDKSRQVNDLIKKMKRQIKTNAIQHAATSHYINNYGYIPLWVVVKVLSFGIMSELYTILKEEEKNELADVYGIEPSVLQYYFPILANYRNLCAHEDILFDHFTQRYIPDSYLHSKLNISKTNGEYNQGKNDIFALVIILKQMLKSDEFETMMGEIIYEIEYLSSKLKVININKILEKMGFPENYKDIIYI